VTATPAEPTLAEKTRAEQALASHAATLNYSDLPATTVKAAKTFLLDTLAVGIAGSTVPESDLLLETACQWSGAGHTTVWGRRVKLDPRQAVLMNAYQIHCQEFDCLHETAVVHAMATLLPVLVAQAQVGPAVDGRAFLTAMVAGIDVASTLGLAAKQGMTFFRPATAGGFGAVAGLARLRGMTAAQTLAAMGHQLAQASGTMQGHTEGSALLPLQIAHNARAAWQACDLAQAGFPSLANPLTGPFGYLPMFERDHNIDALISSLRQRWLIEEFSHKPFPSGRAAHGGIEGLMALRQKHGFVASQVASLTVSGPQLINRLVNRPLVNNPTPSYARLCMPFILAKVLQHGQLDPTHYRGQALTDPITHALANKIHMETDNNPDPNTFSPQTVTVELTNGEVLTIRLESLLASPTRPLSPEAALVKFQRCWEMAAEKLPDSQRLQGNLASLEDLEDVKVLINDLSPA